MKVKHETSYRRDDGTEAIVVPFRDIVVTAPGYFSHDWRDTYSNDFRQERQLREACNKVYPKEADCSETLDIRLSENGGRKKIRTYIEKSKVPKLRRSIKQGMVYGTPRDILFKKRNVLEERNYEERRLSKTTKTILEAKGYLIKQEGTPRSFNLACFYQPSQKNKSLEIRFEFDGRRRAILAGVNQVSVDSLLHRLETSGEGLPDRIRAGLLKKLVKEGKF